MYRNISKKDMDIMFGKADEIWQASVEMSPMEYNQCVAEQMLRLDYSSPLSKKEKKEDDNAL